MTGAMPAIVSNVTATIDVFIILAFRLSDGGSSATH